LTNNIMTGVQDTDGRMPLGVTDIVERCHDGAIPMARPLGEGVMTA
jgi:hypothetical protein